MGFGAWGYGLGLRARDEGLGTRARTTVKGTVREPKAAQKHQVGLSGLLNRRFDIF